MLRANLNLLPTLMVLLETRNISRAAELLAAQLTDSLGALERLYEAHRV